MRYYHSDPMSKRVITNCKHTVTKKLIGANEENH